MKTPTSFFTNMGKYLLLAVLSFNISCATEEIEDPIATTDVVSSEAAQKSPQFDPVETLSDGWYFIRSKHSGKYLDIQNYGKNGEQNVHQWSFTGATNQHWGIKKQSNGSYRIGCYAEGKQYSLEIDSGKTSYGANCQIGLWDWGNQEQQQFYITGSNNSSYFTIKNVNSNKFLDVSAYSKDNGGNVQQWGETGNKNQIWEFFPLVAQ